MGPAGETLYAFFKTTCPTCELTWPYLERLRVLAGDGGVAVVAVSQDDPGRTEAFNERLSTRIPTLYDPPPWRASDAVGDVNRRHFRAVWLVAHLIGDDSNRRFWARLPANLCR